MSLDLNCFRLLAGLLVLGLPAARGLSADADWKAAAGRVIITPQEPQWMAGYAARKAPSEGKIHDLFAKALAVEDANGQRLVIVTTDLIGINERLRTDVEQAVRQSCSLAPAELLMNASHTHCGPELRDENASFYGGAEYGAKARLYAKRTADKIAKLVEQTVKKMKPARLIYSHARAGFAMNRRLPTEAGFRNSPNPDGPVDHRVPVLRVVDADGQLRAVLFGYACHNTTLSFNKFCGDYAGFAQEYIEQRRPQTVALFMTGCGADQNPYPRRTLELAQQHGRALANAVEVGLETARVREVRGPLRVAYDQVTLRFAKPPSAKDLQAGLESNDRYHRRHCQRLLEQLKRDGEIRTEYDFPLQAVQFGRDLTLIAICGETVVDYALRLRRELALPSSNDRNRAGPDVWVAGYSNYVFGYLPSDRVLAEGGYEGGGAMRYTAFPGPFAEGVEDRVVEKIRALVGQIRQAPFEK